MYTTTFAVDAEQVIERVQSITLVTAQSDELEFHWDSVPGAAAYGVVVFDPSEETIVPIPYTNVTETMMVLQPVHSTSSLAHTPFASTHSRATPLQLVSGT